MATTRHSKPRLRRSVLFVSALSTAGFQEASNSGADIVCLDLEDAVPPARKAEARGMAATALRGPGSEQNMQVAARINSLRSLDGLGDILACLARDNTALGAIVLPKVESAEEVRWAGELADEANSHLDLYAIIETNAGLGRCHEIAQSHPRLKALFLGGFDLSTALGCAMEWEPLLYARSRVVHAAASAGIEALDSPFPDVNNVSRLRVSAEKAKSLGMTGKAAKNMEQVAVITEVFTPTSGEIKRAHKILELFDSDPTKPVVFEGKLIELPTIKRLRRISEFESNAVAS
jgi:citrate lyase beta subunit